MESRDDLGHSNRVPLKLDRMERNDDSDVVRERNHCVEFQVNLVKGHVSEAVIDEVSVFASSFSASSSSSCSSILSINSLFTATGVGSSDEAFDVAEEVSSASEIFLLLPFGAGSKGVRQYVTVLVTICRTWTLPDGPEMSVWCSRGEKDALQGAALSGVEEYGEGTDCADARAGENGDWGICSRRGVLAERGPGLTNCEGGMMTRGDSGRVLVSVAALLCDVVLRSVEFES